MSEALDDLLAGDGDDQPQEKTRRKFPWKRVIPVVVVAALAGGGFDPNELALVRSRKIGFVFQSFNLLARTTALQNVELPMFYSRRDVPNRTQRAQRARKAVGILERAHHNPNELSGGQQQRVAIARALVNDPAVILADEPTGALDTRTSVEIMAIFQKLNRAGKTVLMVTHEMDVALHASWKTGPWRRRSERC